MSREVDAVTKLYDYILWLIPKIDGFPRNRKFTLGDRIENMALDILSLLLEASYTKEKRQLLKSANLKLEQLRYLMRLAKDLRLIPPKSYEFSVRAADSVGNSIGGWLRYASR